MAYDEELAERVRALIDAAAKPSRSTVREQKMFGGLSFLVDGNMAVAVSGRGGLLIRVGADAVEDSLPDDVIEPALMGGREMTGWVYLVPEGAAREDVLRRWVGRGFAHAHGLPAKRRGRAKK